MDSLSWSGWILNLILEEFQCWIKNVQEAIADKGRDISDVVDRAETDTKLPNFKCFPFFCCSC